MQYVSRIYLGHGVPSGVKVVRSLTNPNEISMEEFDRFVNDTVAVAFPDGFTLIPANGGWRDASSGQPIKERTTVLEVYHTGSTTAFHKVQNVAVTYRQRFGQDAVMVSTERLFAAVEFL